MTIKRKKLWLNLPFRFLQVSKKWYTYEIDEKNRESVRRAAKQFTNSITSHDVNKYVYTVHKCKETIILSVLNSITV